MNLNLEDPGGVVAVGIETHLHLSNSNNVQTALVFLHKVSNKTKQPPSPLFPPPIFTEVRIAKI